MAQPPPIYLTILRQGDANLIDLAEMGTLIPRSEAHVNDAFLHQLVTEITSVVAPGHSRGEGQAVVRELQRIGALLFSHLLPESARQRLRTAEPCDLYLRLDERLVHIPWELSYDGEQFLVNKFRLGRQVITSTPMRSMHTTRQERERLRVLLIADPTETLPQAGEEAERLCHFFSEAPGVEVTLLGGRVVRKVPLLAALQSHDVIHFAGHSQYDPHTPNHSGWQLHKDIVTVEELGRLTQPPLLVFSNSCQAGATVSWGASPAYDERAFGIGSAFLLAGVKNYIGTFWVVHDEESERFATVFYQHLIAGLSLGEALRRARQQTLTQRGGQGLTWASYMLYGDPTFILLPTTKAQSFSRPSTTPHPQQSQVLQRKLAAILSADVKGYSRLMGDDEVATIHTLTAYRKEMTALIQQHHGIVVDAPGDNLLAEFASAVDAVRCAVEIQENLKVKNAELPEQRQMKFRIGLNVGDVIVEGERLYGDGVNIAARLEALAEGGGICISGTVYDQVKNKLALGYQYLGEQTVKNIAEPVRVYRVAVPSPLVGEGQGEGASGRTGAVHSPHPDSFDLAQDRLPPSGGKEPQKPGRAGFARRKWALVTVIGLLLLMVILAVVRSLPWSLLGVRLSFLGTEQAPTLALPLKPSIAVLPFTNMSGDTEQEYFSDGMTDTLITDLSKLSGLFVIARNSTFAYKDKAIKLQQVSQELGVRYVVEGSVQKADTRVRINTQLVDATTGHHLWAERYDRPLQDIFALQDELTRKIVLALKVKLMPQEQERLRRAPTNKLEAYDVWLRGEAQFWTFTKEANTQARQLFEQAITLDPHYAAAYAALSVTQFMDWLLWAPFQSSLDQVLATAQRAVELDGSLPLAHSVLGYVYTWKKQYDQALIEAQHAVVINPNFADGYYVVSIIFNFMGRWEEAIAAVEKAIELNPTPPAQYLIALSDAYVLAGRYKEAITTAKKALAYNPNLTDAFVLQAVSYSELGLTRMAQTTVTELLKLIPGFSLEVGKLKSPYQDPTIMERRLSLLHEAGIKWYWPTDNAEALGYVWSGFEQMGRSPSTQETIGKARQLFERALERDPQYAAAYAFLGRTYLLEWIGGWEDDHQTLERALELGQKAVNLDSSLSWIRRQLSWVYLWKKQYEQAILEGEQAIALDPMDAEGYAMLAEVLNSAGQPEKALSLAEQALTLAPQNPIFALGEQAFAYELLGRYEEALPLLKKVLAAIPDGFGPHLSLAVVYSKLGQDKEAQAEVKELLRLLPHFSLALMKERYPFKNPAHLQLELAALRKAGLK